MNQKKYLTFLGMLTPMIATLACGSGVLANQQTVEAQEAIFKKATQVQQTVEALQTLVNIPTVTVTPTEYCEVMIDPLGKEFCLVPGDEPPWKTPTPGTSGSFTVSGNSLWVRYYDTNGMRHLVVRRGTTWPGTASGFNFEGWLPEFDFNLADDGKSGKTRCDPHRWDHASKQPLCHSHLIGDASTRTNIDVLAQIPSGWKFNVLSELPTQRWVKDKNGNPVNAEGWIVRFEENVALSK